MSVMVLTELAYSHIFGPVVTITLCQSLYPDFQTYFYRFSSQDHLFPLFIHMVVSLSLAW